MKKLLLLLALLTASLNCFPQFILSGKIENPAGKEDYSLKLNIPFIYGLYEENNINIPVAQNGNFSIKLDIKEQKFVTLLNGRKSFTLLLTPGKTLELEIDSINGEINNFKGTASTENKLLSAVALGKTPFFMHGQRGTNTYAKLDSAGLEEQVVKPWYAQRDKKTALIKSAAIAEKDKELIISEIKYEAYRQLNSFAREMMDFTDRNQIHKFIISTYDGVSDKPDVFPAGPQYYYFADSYIGYFETKAFIKIQQEKQKDDAVLDYYKISIDSGNAIIKKYGKAYINWLAVKNNFDKRVAENYLAQNIVNKYHDKDLKQARSLMDEFEANFPESNYLSELEKKVNTLEELLAVNASNSDIQVFKDYEKVTSIYEVIKTLKGKVVYLDIWGTWCGPCKAELKYNPMLKKHFKGKDVAFVYLDMDDDSKDAEWKDFIRVNALTGLHLRKNRKDIQQIWEELLPDDKSKHGFYPTYFIFDKEGKQAAARAKRPSDQAELYKQIEEVLNK